jgi:ribosomal protein RSM22 (predicted rRNA methylase)
LGTSLKDSKYLAECVLKLSDYFVSKSGSTPWDEAWAQAAYLAYYFPIGYVRGLAVREQLPESVRLSGARVFELGSGPGNVSAAFFDQGQSWSCLEISSSASRLHASLFLEVYSQTISRLINRPKQGEKFDLGLFSFVINELSEVPDFSPFTTVVILEPATHQDFKSFLNIRSQLIQSGFQIVAPCPHDGPCPLSGARDWCHDRIGFQAPNWFSEIEKYLPMRNQTVTFSYLVATRLRDLPRAEARLVGDMLPENGKTRMMVCRGPEREFLSWLHREGEVPRLFRGDKFLLTDAIEKRGNEIRIKRGKS